MVSSVNVLRTAVLIILIFCMFTPAFLPDAALAKSSGGGTGRGAGVGHSGPAGLSTQGVGGGPMTGGGVSFGPAGVSGVGMTGGYQSYGPPTADFQSSQYGYTGPGTFNQPYMQEGNTAFQQNTFTGVQSGPTVATTVPSPGGFSSLQARGISPGTCQWDCTAEYTPTECQQMCQK
jgi:hypothetical protein